MKKNLKAEIKETLYGYVAADSTSNTKKEKKAEKYFLDYFSGKEYFRQHPEYYGAYPVPNDAYGRAAVWAMVKGRGNATVVLIHHNDVVTVEDYKLLKDYAYTPDVLYEKLESIKSSFHKEALEDYDSGDYLFGRGVCDMKGGGSIQMVLLSEYAKDPNFEGNVIVLGVPDEENLSAGMRAGVELLQDLKEKYHLKYKMMINSEPHQRKKPAEGIFSLGSIGKLMPFVYIRGYLAHAGKVFEGLNPVNIMSEIVRRTEVNMEISDAVGKEAAPPPTWLYLRENKQSYDVSMPLTMNGCLSILTLNRYPADVMQDIRRICEESFDAVLKDMNRNYQLFLKKTKQPQKNLLWETKVVDFGQLYKEAEASYGTTFCSAFAAKMEELEQDIEAGKTSLLLANFDLVDFVYNYIDDLSPRIVIGLMPPYYPNVSNITNFPKETGWKPLQEKLCAYTKQHFGQTYTTEYFYTGISDLSYSSIQNPQEVSGELERTMPFYGKIYSLSVDSIREISMPCINIGPWGKDFHKITERVLTEDLYERTPKILDYAIQQILKEEPKKNEKKGVGI